MINNTKLLIVFVSAVLSATLVACVSDSGSSSSSAAAPARTLNITDYDNDTIADEDDNCPMVPNTGQVDDDGDLVGNACDNCLMLNSTNQANQDNDDYGDLCDIDLDGDGHNNTVDNCPGIANAGQANLFGNGTHSDMVGDACDDLDGDAAGVTMTTYDSNLSDDGATDTLTTVRAIIGGRNFDANDNCVGIANPDQSNRYGNRSNAYPNTGDACEDSDGDGGPSALTDTEVTVDGTTTSYVSAATDLVDARDNCPARANADQQDLDGDGRTGGGDVCDDSTTIATAGNLTMMIGNDVNVNYKLTTDLNVSTWTPEAFLGKFDGSNRAINFTSVTTLFTTIARTATVENVGILGGILAETNNGTIHQAYATGADVGSSASDDDIRGGLVRSNYHIISNSYATGNVASQASGTNTAYSGGLVGWNIGDISQSYAIGNVSATNASADANSYSGGLVGWNQNGSILDAYATGDSFSNGSSGSASGGLIGHLESLESLGQFNRTYAVGNADGANLGSNAGGLIGSISASLQTSINAARQSSGIDDYDPLFYSYRLEGSGSNTFGVSRNITQLQCPTMAGENCAGNITYYRWNAEDTIWNFGGNETLPTLVNIPSR